MDIRSDGLRFVILSVMAIFSCSGLCFGTEFYFAPDTAMGDTGLTVLLSGRITESVLMRGFTVYMTYDTNLIDLSEPPVAGSLIAGRDGLQFNYFDHVPIHPDRLEIGATVFGTDFWAGPGELFQVRFTLRECADAPITAPGPPFFVDANGDLPEVTFDPALVAICARTPAAPAGLTISPSGEFVALRWHEVTTDYLGRPLFQLPLYEVFRQQVWPAEGQVEMIASTTDTMFTDSSVNSAEFIYYIVAQSDQ